MQCLREEQALVPQPRGNLPRACAVALATMAIAAILLLYPPERSCGLVAMAILILTLGPLLHGVCLLGEELLYHANTRYRGQGLLGCILLAWGMSGRRTLVTALLGGLLLCLSETPLLGNGQYWALLVLAPSLYPLLKTLGTLGPLEVEVSEICEGRKMNVAHGLAWSFYLGYLRLVLPRLEDSISAFRASHQPSLFRGRGSRKLIIIIPLNANIANKLEEEDNNICFHDNLPNTEMDRAGVRGRVYKHSVYSVLDENGQAHNCVVEYATPLLTLYSMSQESTAGFGEAERRQQVLLFYRTLQEVLERSLECRNRYRLILLNDDYEEDPHFLSKTILRHLQQQDREEFCLTPTPHQDKATDKGHPVATPTSVPPPEGHWRRAEPMSREPTLMFSLERPMPLKEAVEDTYHQKGSN